MGSGGGDDSESIRIERPAAEGMVLRTASGQFRILEIDPDGCLIEASKGSVLRGWADIYQNDRQMARCLIVLGTTMGDLMRCAFKHSTPARSEPPSDFVR